jgi:4-oxalocrotonate tautomerase
LRKDPKVAAVIVTFVPPDDWFCGGRSLGEVHLASFWLDIHITDGSNTKDEKAAFIGDAEAMSALHPKADMCAEVERINFF